MIPRAHAIAIVVLILCACVVSAVFFPRLEEEVPVHWNVDGQPDRVGSKWQPLLLGPCAATGIVLMMMALVLLGPLRRNIQSFRVTYGRILVLVVATMLAIHLVVLLKAAGSMLDVGRTLAIVLGMMIAVLGNWLSKVRRNFWIGIRTPWTLMSDTVWEKTHRLGARLFVAAGTASVLAGLVGSGRTCLLVMIGSIVAAALSCVVYSIVIYQRVGEADEVTWDG
jgi:uncharacterized membrane protein